MKIRNKLLSVSLLITLLPLAIIGAAFLWQGHSSLSSQAFKQLESLREIKKAQIEVFFSERHHDMTALLNLLEMLRQNASQKLRSLQENKVARLESFFRKHRNNVIFLAESHLAGQALEQFDGAVKVEKKPGGLAWQSIDARLGAALRKHWQQYAYYDLLLIGTNGTIVFSARQASDLGQNILSKEWQQQALQAAFQTGLERVHLEDFAPYSLAQGKHIGFFTAPVHRLGQLVGVLALAIDLDSVGLLLEQDSSLGGTEQSYLLGHQDGQTRFRSDRFINGIKQQASIGQLKDSPHIERALWGESVLHIGIDEDVLRISAYAPLAIPELHWCIVSSINLEEVFTPTLSGEDLDFFSKYVQAYDYYDLLLIHPQGKIFYSVKKEADYNSNLFNGPYSHTQLGRLFQDVLQKKHFSVSDYAPYPPSGNIPSAFLAKPLLDANGDVEMVIALQLHDSSLNTIMQQRAGMGKTGETYLVGEDKLMRSNSFLDPQQHSVISSFTHPYNGRVDTPSARAALNGETGEHVIHNYLDNEVLSAYTPLNVGTNRWALIAEISTAEALAALHELQWFLSLLGLALCFLLLLSINQFTNKLVTPLLQIRRQLRALARGHILRDDPEYSSHDEVAEIVGATFALKRSIQNIIEQANAIATGNYRKDICLLSSRDQLGRALKNMTDTLGDVIQQANAIAAGDYDQEVKIRSEQDQLGQALAHMTQQLRTLRIQTEYEDWIKTGLTRLNDEIRGEQDMVALGRKTIVFLSRYLNAQLGLFYVANSRQDEEILLHLLASYAYQHHQPVSTIFSLGEGLVGQAALERNYILVAQIPEDYLLVRSGSGQAKPKQLLLIPFFYENELKGVVEIASFSTFEPHQIDFLQRTMASIGIAVNSAQSRTRLQALLTQSQSQTEELQSQAEELQVQQEELRQANEELARHAHAQEQQKAAISKQNLVLEKTRQEIEIKARELENSSRYKSEFLANMSHELRTPLNSMLLLAQLLESDGHDGKLSEKQKEYARTIYSAGQDLLKLINEILDLSKIEAGKMELHSNWVSLSALLHNLEQKFRPLADSKHLEFKIEKAAKLPEQIYIDEQRLQQILNNLVANALKFTSQGRVSLAVQPLPPVTASAGVKAEGWLAFAISDTGVGIPEAQQEAVFNAFQQGDGTTTRKYGGTGLGLSISRRLTELLQGKLELRSKEGVGSCFTLKIPLSSPQTKPAPRLGAETDDVNGFASKLKTHTEAESSSLTRDDRENLQTGDRTLLIIEDDRQFADILQNLAHEKDFRCLLAGDGESGLEMAQTYLPQAIVLDLNLPRLDGWSVLTKLKQNLATRHIPVYFISASNAAITARRFGAIAYLSKPVSMQDLAQAFQKIKQFLATESRKLLLFSRGSQHCKEILQVVNTPTIQTDCVEQLQPAWQKVKSGEFDALIIDLEMTNELGFELLDRLQNLEESQQLPVLLYNERPFTEIEAGRLQQYGDSLLLKEIKSLPQLFDEVTLFLHQMEVKLPEEKRSMLEMLHNKKNIFINKSILLVDDDVRNTFALKTLLEDKKMRVLTANNGKEALQVIDSQVIDLVLMDMMMPEMDGYAAIRAIRKRPRCRRLPIIALTAKAMPTDRHKCIQAGANDYLSKPMDGDKLLALMRVWLSA